MKTFLLRLLAFFSIPVALSAVIVCLVLPRISLYTKPFDGWRQRCASVGERHGKPKMVLVGGSNLACGVDAPCLDELLNHRYEVVNLGFHAGLGVGVHLDLIDRFLESGDVVVFAVEYSNWSAGWDGGLPATIFRCDVQNRNLFTSTVGCRWSRLQFGQAHHYVLEKIRRLTGSFQVFEEPKDPGPKMSREVAAVQSDVDSAPQPGYAQKAVVYGERFAIDPSVVRLVRKLAEEFSSRGIRILLSSPVYDSRHYELHAQEIGVIYGTLSNIAGLDQISTPTSSIFPLEEMNDSPWHVNRIGREKRTARLAADIIRWEAKTDKQKLKSGAPRKTIDGALMER